MSEDVVTTLQEIGLTEYQSRAYTAAVRLGRTRFTTLSDEAKIPQQRIYDVVEDLKQLGLVEVYESGDGKEVLAIPPQEGLMVLKEQHLSQFEARLEDAVSDLGSIATEAQRPSDYVTVVNHYSSVRRHITNAIESADWWLFLSLPLEWYSDFKQDVRDVVARDVTVRLLVQTDDVAMVENTSYHDGLSVRCRPAADIVVTADRDYGLFRGLSSPSVSRPSLVTRNESIVEMLQRYSEQFWTGSRDVQSRHSYPHRYLTPWRAVRDHRDQLASGADVEAYVEGHDTETGEPGTWTGPIVDYEISSGRDADYAVVLPEVARLTVETTTRQVTVGGWDATLEDVAAHGIEIRRD